MSLAAWKDLCIDANDASLLGRFWGELLGRDVEDLADGDVVLRGVRPADTVWVNTVPEPKSVKHRVHLDLRMRSLEAPLDLGAAIVAPAGDSGGPWTVLADPEGGEFCAFLRDDHDAGAPAALFEIVVDTADSQTSEAQARWWADVLGGTPADDGRGFWWVEDLAGAPFETLDFVPVPEPKQVKNRLHWDVTSDALETLVARGASVLREPTTDTRWHVLADPEGNEFCVFSS